MNRRVVGMLGTLAACIGVLAVPVLTVPAGPAASTGASPLVPAAEAQHTAAARSDPHAIARLQRAARAPGRTPYSGTQFVMTWRRGASSTFVVDVDHMPGHGTVVRVGGTAANPHGIAFTTASDLARSFVEDGAGPTTPDGLRLLVRNYAVSPGDPATVAGRPADVVDVRRPDWRLVARFWVDEATGLLLRREVYDASGGTIRATAYVDLQVGFPVFVHHLPPLLPDPVSQRVSPAELDWWREQGWTCPEALPDAMTLLDVRRMEGTQGPILYLTYSDGLSTVSLFEQRGQLDVGRLHGFGEQPSGVGSVYVSDGYPHQVVWSAGGTVYSVLADAPDSTVEAVVAALPQERPGGAVDRLRRGLSRLGSWLDPLG